MNRFDDHGTGIRMSAYRYEKTTSIIRTNLLSMEGKNGEMKAGRKKATEVTAWNCRVRFRFFLGSASFKSDDGLELVR